MNYIEPIFIKSILPINIIVYMNKAIEWFVIRCFCRFWNHSIISWRSWTFNILLYWY